MLRRFVLTAALAAFATPVLAQNGQVSSQCAAENQAADACQKATDLFAYMAPQLGTIVAGGNATLGQGGTLGGFGHFSIGVRANALMGQLPQLNNVQVSTTGAQRSNIDTKSQIFPMPTVDAAIGVFKGLPLGVTNVGGIDLLVSASYIPSYTNSQVKIDAGSMKIGFGARVGILQEGILTPGLSVTYLKRDLPTLSITGYANNNTDTLTVSNLEVKTTAWRVVASKSFLLFGLAAGYGQDKYSSSTALDVKVHEGVCAAGCSGTVADFGQDVTRTNLFLDASINLPIVKLTGEVGQVSGGTINTYNTFAKAADESRLYASAGLRIKF